MNSESFSEHSSDLDWIGALYFSEWVELLPRKSRAEGAMSLSKNSAPSAAAAGGSGGGGGYMTYFDYHGIEPGAYYGVPYRQVSGLESFGLD